MDQNIEKYVKRQYYFSMATAICSIGILVVAAIAAVTVVPALTGTLNEVRTAMHNLNTMTENLNEMMQTLSSVTDELAPSLEGLREVTEGIESVDFARLNQAISDLQSVVSPLAKLFGR